MVINDQSNWVGRLNEDAVIAEEELSSIPLGADTGAYVTSNIAEYLSDWPRPTSAFPDNDQTIAEFVSAIAETNGEDGCWFAGDLKDALFDAWSEILYQGDSLPQAVAQALIEDGRCEDSARTEELAAYARGERPE